MQLRSGQVSPRSEGLHLFGRGARLSPGPAERVIVRTPTQSFLRCDVIPLGVLINPADPNALKEEGIHPRGVSPSKKEIREPIYRGPGAIHEVSTGS